MSCPVLASTYSPGGRDLVRWYYVLRALNGRGPLFPYSHSLATDFLAPAEPAV